MVFLWEYGILTIAMAIALAAGRESRAVGTLVALFGPFVFVALSCVTIGAPNLRGTWSWGPWLIGEAALRWTLEAVFPLPIPPVIMLATAIVIIVRSRNVESSPNDNGDESDLVRRFSTRARD